MRGAKFGAIRPDGGHGIRRIHEGVVFRDAAIVVQAMNLAIGPVKPLCLIPLAAIADGEIQIARFVKHDPGPEVLPPF